MRQREAGTWMCHVYLGGGEVWHLIRDSKRFVRQWERAMRRREFMPVRYAGVDYYVNPLKITMVSECEL